MSISNKNDFIKWESSTRDTIDLKRTYVDLFERLTGGVLFSQLMFYFLPVQDEKTRLFRDHYKLIWIGDEQWVPMRRGEWWEACRVREDEADTVLRESGLEVDANGQVKEAKPNLKRPKPESRNLIIYRTTLLENSNKKTHILRPNWPVFFERLNALLDNYQPGGRDTPSPDVPVPEREPLIYTPSPALSPSAVFDLPKNGISVFEAASEGSISCKTGNRSSTKTETEMPFEGRSMLPKNALPSDIEVVKEVIKTTTTQPAIAGEVDVEFFSSKPASPNQPPLPQMAVISITATPLGEPKFADGLAARLVRWAEDEGRKLDTKAARRITTQTTLAGAGVADLDREPLEAHLKDFKALRLPRAIFGKNVKLLTGDTEFLRWVLWLWPLHLGDLTNSGQLNAGGPNLSGVFVFRAGFSDGGKGEATMVLPPVEWLDALIREDGARSASIERDKQNAREAQNRAREREEREALDEQIRAMSEDDRRALFERASEETPGVAMLQGQTSNPNGAIMAEMRRLVADGWTPDAARRRASWLRHDAPEADIEAAFDALDDATRAEIEAEAISAVASLSLQGKARQNALAGRRRGILRERIKNGLQIEAPSKKERQAA